MPSGVSNNAEDTSSNTSITNLPNYQSCFIAEIVNAFAAWSAVSNIKFTQVSDNSLAFNHPSAKGDIRIGSHYIDGNSGALAHAFLPPPNGYSAAGDLHFDSSENWTCNTSGIDIGIVALHEIGHSIGLDHADNLNEGESAVMEPYYSPALTNLLIDDKNGAVRIYGKVPAVTNTSSSEFSYMVPIIQFILSN
jgi:hypothetical protein